ncbi:cell division protein BolA [Aliidiomarina minuta]|uniref:Cell division protein BolA n=1 Tax=Aliidiomarina minuta TaxID=880057 RepID=A0A432W9J0_9GAMM|nr:BolA family protein [Aliidiomarina minuta]RUO26646.1 cell division protein BolA [Aliidiomarina minuta]
MEPAQIQDILREAIDLEEVYVKSDGSHVEVIAVAEVFGELSRVKQQQLIYAPLKPAIADGSIHAVSIKAYTPAQWQREKKLVMPN